MSLMSTQSLSNKAKAPDHFIEGEEPLNPIKMTVHTGFKLFFDTLKAAY